MPTSYIQHLEKKRRSKNNDIKFIVANSILKQKANNDKINQTYTLQKYLLNNERITSSDNAILILAFIQNNSLYQQQVVIKIDRHIEELELEYNISKILSKIGFFINYLAFYTCYDNTNNIKEFKNSKAITNNMINKPLSICNPMKIDNNLRGILAMNYYKNGSINHYKWTMINLTLLKKLIKQIIESCYKAYKYYGFLHIDLHLGNILIDDNNNAIIIDLTQHQLFGNLDETNYFTNPDYITYIFDFWDIISNLIDNLQYLTHYNSIIRLDRNLYDKFRIDYLHSIFNNNILNDDVITQLLLYIDELPFIEHKPHF